MYYSVESNQSCTHDAVLLYRRAIYTFSYTHIQLHTHSVITCTQCLDHQSHRECRWYVRGESEPSTVRATGRRSTSAALTRRGGGGGGGGGGVSGPSAGVHGGGGGGGGGARWTHRQTPRRKRAPLTVSSHYNSLFKQTTVEGSRQFFHFTTYIAQPRYSWLAPPPPPPPGPIARCGAWWQTRSL